MIVFTHGSYFVIRKYSIYRFSLIPEGQGLPPLLVIGMLIVKHWGHLGFLPGNTAWLEVTCTSPLFKSPIPVCNICKNVNPNSPL